MNKIEKFDSGMHYAMVDKEIVNSFLTKGTKRALCSIENTTFHCAFMPKKEGGYFINIGAKICNQLNLQLGDVIIADFKEDLTAYQFEMPEEFIEVLYQEDRKSVV